jgi:hypothetical protein
MGWRVAKLSLSQPKAADQGKSEDSTTLDLSYHVTYPNFASTGVALEISLREWKLKVADQLPRTTYISAISVFTDHNITFKIFFADLTFPQ